MRYFFLILSLFAGGLSLCNFYDQALRNPQINSALTETQELILASFSEQRAIIDAESRNKICQLYRTILAAAKLSPIDPMLHLAWAFLQFKQGEPSFQEGGHFPGSANAECAPPLKPGASQATISPPVRLNYAATFSGVNSASHYFLALTALIVGERHRALEWFRLSEELARDNITAQREFVLSMIKQPGELAEVFPERFPQALYWFSLLRERRPQLLHQGLPEIAKRMRRALEHYELCLLEADCAAVDYYRTLQAVLSQAELSRDDALWQDLSARLSRFFAAQQKPEISQFFLKRAKLARRVLPLSQLLLDAAPERNGFKIWRQVDPLSAPQESPWWIKLDQFSASLGLYRPPGVNISLVVFVSRYAQRGLKGRYDEREIEVWESADNKQFRLSDVPLREYFDGVRRYLVFDLRERQGSYFKFRYSSVQADLDFRDKVEQLVQVYG